MSAIRAVIKLMRPEQWIKNGFVVMPLVFSGRLYSLEDGLKVFGMVLAFCLASSATYVLNDYMDMEHDRVHPLKRHRPLASGQVTVWAAAMALVLLVIGTFAVAWFVGDPMLGYLFLALYMVLQVLYSVKLKNILIVDVLTIACGFMLRVLAGAVVIGVTVSSWLLMCTFSVAILLALGKRRHEVVVLNQDAVCHRPVLECYSVSLLDQLVQVATTSTFIFYCLYSVRGNPATGLQSERMMFTIPLVTYGIFRYLYLIYHREDGGSPTALLLTDPPLLSCTILWLTACIAIMYL